MPDMRAFKATRHLLLSAPNKIVIFPEGEVSHQNDFLLEFENGPEHIGLSAMEEMKSMNANGSIYMLTLTGDTNILVIFLC